MEKNGMDGKPPLSLRGYGSHPVHMETVLSVPSPAGMTVHIHNLDNKSLQASIFRGVVCP